MLDSMCMYNILTKHHTLYAFTVCILNTCLGVNITPPLVEDVAYFVCHHSGKKRLEWRQCVCAFHILSILMYLYYTSFSHMSASVHWNIIVVTTAYLYKKYIVWGTNIMYIVNAIAYLVKSKLCWCYFTITSGLHSVPLVNSQDFWRMYSNYIYSWALRNIIKYFILELLLLVMMQMHSL